MTFANHMNVCPYRRRAVPVQNVAEPPRLRLDSALSGAHRAMSAHNYLLLRGPLPVEAPRPGLLLVGTQDIHGQARHPDGREEREGDLVVPCELKHEQSGGDGRAEERAEDRRGAHLRPARGERARETACSKRSARPAVARSQREGGRTTAYCASDATGRPVCDSSSWKPAPRVDPKKSDGARMPPWGPGGLAQSAATARRSGTGGNGGGGDARTIRPEPRQEAVRDILSKQIDQSSTTESLYVCRAPHRAAVSSRAVQRRARGAPTGRFRGTGGYR